jgi:hypothetical protein
MQAKYITLCLVEFFKTLPAGDYHPFIVRNELGLSAEAWGNYARAFLYPHNSKARVALQAVGVTVQSKKNDQVGTHTCFLSTFIKGEGG